MAATPITGNKAATKATKKIAGGTGTGRRRKTATTPTLTQPTRKLRERVAKPAMIPTNQLQPPVKERKINRQRRKVGINIGCY